MKKQIAIAVLIFSGHLSIPWTVSAQEFEGASWYGSLNATVVMGGGEDSRYEDNGSHWGILGSNEISEGLSANYHFEHEIDTSDASLPGGTLANVGLTGSIGTVSLGQISSASSNAIDITDLGQVNSSTETSGEISNALSYAVSVGNLSMQIDAVMDGGKDSDSAIDQLEFGLTLNISDNITLAVAHTNIRDERVTTTTITDVHYRVGDMKMDDLEKITVNTVDNAELSGAMLNDPVNGVTYYLGEYFYRCDASDSTTAIPDCTTDAEIFAVYEVVPGTTTGGSDATVNINYYGEEVVKVPAGRMTSMSTEVGSKTNHVAVLMGLGSLSAYLTHSQTEMNDSNMKSKVTRYGLSGDIGDDGLGFYAMARSLDPAVGLKSTPWLAGMTKELGDGALAFVEYFDPDDGESGTTHFGLVVDF